MLLRAVDCFPSAEPLHCSWNAIPHCQIVAYPGFYRIIARTTMYPPSHATQTTNIKRTCVNPCATHGAYAECIGIVASKENWCILNVDPCNSALIQAKYLPITKKGRMSGLPIVNAENKRYEGNRHHVRRNEKAYESDGMLIKTRAVGESSRGICRSGTTPSIRDGL